MDKKLRERGAPKEKKEDNKASAAPEPKSESTSESSGKDVKLKKGATIIPKKIVTPQKKGERSGSAIQSLITFMIYITVVIVIILVSFYVYELIQENNANNSVVNSFLSYPKQVLEHQNAGLYIKIPQRYPPTREEEYQLFVKYAGTQYRQTNDPFVILYFNPLPNLIPGTFVFRDFINHLSESKSCFVAAFDFLGFGLSDKKSSLPFDNLSFFVDMLQNVFLNLNLDDDERINFLVVGDLSAEIFLRFSEQNPLLIKSVLFSNTFFTFDSKFSHFKQNSLSGSLIPGLDLIKLSTNNVVNFFNIFFTFPTLSHNISIEEVSNLNWLYKFKKGKDNLHKFRSLYSSEQLKGSEKKNRDQILELNSKYNVSFGGIWSENEEQRQWLKEVLGAKLNFDKRVEGRHLLVMDDEKAFREEVLKWMDIVPKTGKKQIEHHHHGEHDHGHGHDHVHEHGHEHGHGHHHGGHDHGHGHVHDGDSGWVDSSLYGGIPIHHHH